MNKANDNMHMNPSKRKISSNSFKKPTQTGTVTSVDQKNGSLLRIQSLSLLQDTGSQQATNLVEDNRQLREYLEKLKQNNRQLITKLSQKQATIVKTDCQYRQLLQRYRSELRKANVQRKSTISLQASSSALSFRLTPARSSRVSSYSREKQSQRKSRQKLLQLRQSLQTNFRDIQKIAFPH